MSTRPAILATLFAFAAALPCAAEEVSSAPLSAAELDDLRGGFMLPTGIEANFGAVARTYADNTLLLETHFTWTPNGVERQNAVVSPLLGDASEVLPGAFELRDLNGATILAHQADAHALRNVILNDASGRTLRAEFELTVTLPGFSAVQSDFDAARLALRLTDDLNAASSY